MALAVKALALAVKALAPGLGRREEGMLSLLYVILCSKEALNKCYKHLGVVQVQGFIHDSLRTPKGLPYTYKSPLSYIRKPFLC